MNRLKLISTGVSVLVASSLWVVACDNGPASVDAAMGGDPHPFADEPKGESHTNWARIEVEGPTSPRTKAEYSGEYTPSEADSEYVRCSYGNDPGNLGHTRLLVELGTVGFEPMVALTLRDFDEPSAQMVEYAVGDGTERLSLALRRPTSAAPLLAYAFGKDAERGSECWVDLVELSEARAEGTVSCSDLVESPPVGTSTVAASVSFDCELGEGGPITATGGQSGAGGSPAAAGGQSSVGGAVGGSVAAGGGTASGGATTVCSDGELQACVGEGECEGTQVCAAGQFGACECPTPDLTLQKLVPWADSYDSYVGQTYGSGLSSLASSMASAGYVITGAVANSVPYTLFGVRPTGSTKPYEAKMIQETGSTLAGGVGDLGLDGYLPTVGVVNSVYTIIGMRDPENPVTYLTRVQQTTGSYLRDTVQDMGADGYIPMVVMTGSIPYTVIGVKPSDSADVYDCNMMQAVGSDLDNITDDLVNAGYTVTSLVDNSVPFTVVAARKKGQTTPLKFWIDQTYGSTLSSTVDSFSTDGYLLLAATGQDVPYTMIAVKP